MQMLLLSNESYKKSGIWLNSLLETPSSVEIEVQMGDRRKRCIL